MKIFNNTAITNNIPTTNNAANKFEALLKERKNPQNLAHVIDNYRVSINNDLEIMHNTINKNDKDVGIRDYMQLMTHTYEMSIKHELFSKLAAKGVQGFESLLKNQ